MVIATSMNFFVGRFPILLAFILKNIFITIFSLIKDLELYYLDILIREKTNKIF
jgi:hypothetical protein